MYRLALLALVSACAVDPAAALPADAAPLPMFYTLSASAGVAPGGMVSFAISGLAPGQQVRLVGSSGDIAAGNCPPALSGGCLDISSGASGYRPITTLTGDGAGEATYSVTLPPNVAPGAWVFQAVDPALARGSNPVAVGVMCPDLPPSAATTVIDCTAPGACSATNVVCPDGQDCFVHCGGVSACQVGTIQCPMGGNCEVLCDNTSTCQVADVFGGDGDLSITCTGASACQLTDLVCGTGNCEATCDPTMGRLGTIDSSAACALANDHCL